MYIEKLNNIKHLISRFLGGEISEELFKSEYLKEYVPLKEYLESNWQGKPYYPLNELPDMNGPQLIEFAEMAFPRIPKEILARETWSWVKENLTVDGDYFKFIKDDGQSLFGSFKVLYKTEIEDSLILSAMAGKVKRAEFNYSNLLSSIQNITNNEPAAWVSCCEPDNAFANVEMPWTLGNVYKEFWHIDKLARIEPQSVQGGDCYKLLLPKNKEWMLLHSYDFSSLSIILHGTEPFIGNVLSITSDCGPKSTHFN